MIPTKKLNASMSGIPPNANPYKSTPIGGSFNDYSMAAITNRGGQHSRMQKLKPLNSFQKYYQDSQIMINS